MALNLGVPQPTELKPRITVFGVGGAGGNGVNNMIDAGLEGVEFVVANTDAQALAQSRAEHKIQLGAGVTQGLGAGAQPEVGRAAAEEALEDILSHLDGCHMVFVTAGMGGGTGTGAAPVIAAAAKDRGILTIGVVTKPFAFEGSRRMVMADQGIADMQQYVDTLIVIPNQNLFRLANEKTTFADAFAMADNVLRSGVCGITDLMVMPGLINLDFADVKTVMAEMGKAMMGTGEAETENRAIEAAEAAISNPLLDDVSMEGARGVLINITGGMDMTLFEVDAAANRIRKEVDPDANIIVGSTFNESMEGRMRVSVVATGIDCEADQETPFTKRSQLHVVSTKPAIPAKPAQTAAEVVAEPRQAEVSDSAFIPPAPIKRAAREAEPVMMTEPEAETELPLADDQPDIFSEMEQPVAEQAQPVAEQPVEEAPRILQETAEPKRKKGGLIERVLGLSLDRSGTAPAPQAEPRRVEPQLHAEHAEAEPVARTEANPAPRPQTAAPAPKPELASDNASLFEAEEDPDGLDIPAFLRRQAN